jgi:putative transposase
MCRLLEVSRSGYYAWRNRTECERAKRDQELREKVRHAHAQSGKKYGSPRIHGQLKAEGVRCGRKRIARLMQADGLVGLQRKKYRKAFGGAAEKIAANTLERGFAVKELNRVWAGDITYLPTAEGWLYLAVLIDLASRRVVGWSMRKDPDHRLTLGALAMAVNRRGPAAGLLHHSDRGVQYTCRAYPTELDRLGVTVSMSRKGNCWDNAVVESFFSTLKLEGCHNKQFATRAEARRAVFEFIEVWYNRQRLHSTLGYLSPDTFESQAA